MLNEDSPYTTTVELCAYFRCTARTLKRWQEREVNPMPAPVMRPSGQHFLYEKDAIEKWKKVLLEESATQH